MQSYVTGEIIRGLREKRRLTQRDLAQRLNVSDKTISKWETGRGLPDITLLEPLAGALSVSVTELLSGDCAENRNRAGNLSRSLFYVCPVCGNVIWSVGEGAYSCCGVSLPPLEAEEPDDAHTIHAEKIEMEWYVTLDHPMDKQHFIPFLGLVILCGAGIYGYLTSGIFVQVFRKYLPDELEQDMDKTDLTYHG